MLTHRSHALVSSPSAATLTDQQLVARVLQGHSAEFTYLIHRTEGLVAHLVVKMIRHPADRPDVVQEVYLKVFKSLAGFKFQAKFSTWVGQITYNTCLHYLEKKQLVLIDPLAHEAAAHLEEEYFTAPVSIADADTDPETILFSQDLTTILRTAIEQLPPLYSTLVSLYHQQELSYEEIIQITSLPEGTVKTYLFRARKMLKQYLLAHYQRDDL